VPYFYFQGAVDANTPMSEAWQHFKNVSSSSSVFIEFPDLGHSVISNLTSCTLFICPPKSARDQSLKLLAQIFKNHRALDSDRFGEISFKIYKK
jgi:hypothetical protein